MANPKKNKEDRRREQPGYRKIKATHREVWIEVSRKLPDGRVRKTLKRFKEKI